MDMGSIVVLVILLVAVAMLIIRPSGRPVHPVAVATAPDKTIDLPATMELTADIKWWQQLQNKDQLKLAIRLADICMPVWNKYNSAGSVSYRDATSMAMIVIDKDLLGNSLLEMIAAGVSQSNGQGITDCYNHFVGPVIALHDGDWVPPYAIKKYFYLILIC